MAARSWPQLCVGKTAGARVGYVARQGNSNDDDDDDDDDAIGNDDADYVNK